MLGIVCLDARGVLNPFVVLEELGCDPVGQVGRHMIEGSGLKVADLNEDLDLGQSLRDHRDPGEWCGVFALTDALHTIGRGIRRCQKRGGLTRNSAFTEADFLPSYSRRRLIVRSYDFPPARRPAASIARLAAYPASRAPPIRTEPVRDCNGAV